MFEHFGTTTKGADSRVDSDSAHSNIDDRPSAPRGIVSQALTALSVCVLGAFLVLPLGWKEQAIFGALLILGVMLLSRASRSENITLALIAISLFSTFRYGYWRVTQTWDGITSAGHLRQWDTAFVLLLLFAECYAFVTLTLGYFQTLRPLKRRPVPLIGDPHLWPTVDVFIPTYNEPLSVVRATVFGALAMDYPADRMNVVILDDGRRDEFRDFAMRIGAGYLTRDGNAHAKAGNINHALARTHAEFVAIFDCDHVPTRSFLRATLGWCLRDPHLGLVQTPHHFYSPDPFERNLGQFRKIPNEGELFHRLVQDGNDLWNASFFCGSCAVLRRRALDEIGGIAVETVTEDAHTALRLQCRGWNTAYINIPQAAGLATENLAAHIGQRIRWARGMVQILRLENPLLAAGLSLSQRLCYFNATTHFLFAVPRLIFLTMPLAYLLLGIVNIYGYSLAVFAYALPHIVISNITNSRIQGRYRFSFWNEIYEAVLAPYILFPTLLALVNPRLGKFNVTSKGGIIRRSYFDRRVALPFVFLLGINVAGLVMAERRYFADPAHHDTIVMNAIWTAYNIVILSVAASVARERRQRRSEVRVDVRVPMTLLTTDGHRLAGMTANLSRQGGTVELDSEAKLVPRGRVLLMFGSGRTRWEIPARVVKGPCRALHLRFRELASWQERRLFALIYSRPDTWVAWDSLRPVDRPLRSVARILWLALRGIVIVAAGLIAPPRLFRRRGKSSPERVEAATVSGVLIGMLALTPVGVHASGSVDLGKSPASTGEASMFHEQTEFSQMGVSQPAGLRGAGATLRMFFDVPITKIISEATLDLLYTAPALRAREASVNVWLNGTLVGSAPIDPGTDLHVKLPLPTDLLARDNAIALSLEGGCAGCVREGTPWITISPRSAIRHSGTRLAIANDLSLLPVPFFDPSGQHSWKLPIVFWGRPDSPTLEAAAVVASWFGVLSDVRSVRFPVTIGELPRGNAVVLALRGSAVGVDLKLPAAAGPQIAIRDHPRDPYGKLLILTGDRPEDLLTAARALVSDDKPRPHVDTLSVRAVGVKLRQQYDAPRWLQTDRPAAIGMYTSDERLKLKSAGSINIYFRLAPDLFLAARQSVPLLLKFGYAGVAHDTRAALHVRLNGQDVDSIRLAPAATSVERVETVQLPTGRLRPYINTLTLDVDFGGNPSPTTSWPYAAIHRDSSIDLRGLPHSVVLPRLELFADACYPFTQWADLDRTAVVLSEAAGPEEFEALLAMVGFCGAQTGWPATSITITDPSRVETVRDKDLVVLGTPESQPLLSTWADSMPVAVSPDGLRLNPRPLPSPWLHPLWPFRSEDHSRLARVVAEDRRLDALVQAFVSPFRHDRSVLVITTLTPAGRERGVTMFLPAERQGPLYGGVSALEAGAFQSFLVGYLAYHDGRINAYQRNRVFLLEHYWLIPLFVMLFAAAIGAHTRAWAERVASQRLSDPLRGSPDDAIMSS